MNSPIKQPEQQVPSSCAFRSVDDFDWDNGTLVGSGRMSVVMACKTVAGRVISDHESSVPPTLALKSISKTRILQTKGAFERLRLEKKVLLELQEDAHPGVVKLFGTLQSEEYVYFALEYGQGGDLMQYVRQYGALPVEACRVLTAQLVLTLSYLQEKGIVHRDIKAENLCFRTPHHSLFLIDFEHAVYCRNEPDPASATLAEDNTDDEREDIHYTVQEVHAIRRKSEAFCGTPTTMSPEMLCSCSWSYASDLWALGCVLYLMLTGKEPFGRNNMNLIDTFRCIVHEQEAHLERQLKADSPPEVDSSARDLVLGLLRKDPSQRFGTPQRGGMAALRAHSFFSDINWDESDVFRSHPFLEEHPPQLSTAYARALHEDGDGILTEEYLNQIFTNS